MRNKIRKGLPISPVKFTGEIIGQHLTVGEFGEYNSIDDVLVLLSSKTWKVEKTISGSVDTVYGSENVVGHDTNFFDDVSENDFILINGNLQAVRDIQSNGLLRLWHGAMSNETGASIDVKKLNNYSIEILNNQDINVSAKIPDGVGIKFIAQTSNLILSADSFGLSCTKYNYIEVEHITISSGVNGAIPFLNNASDGVSGSSRCIFNLHDFYQAEKVAGVGLLAIYGASITITPARTKDFRSLLQSDYLYIEMVSHQTTIQDIILFDTVNAYDVAYDHEIININLSRIGTPNSAASMLETNQNTPAKIVNIRNANIYFEATEETLGVDNDTSIPLYAPFNCTWNIIDSVVTMIDFIGSAKIWYEAWDRGGTLNIINSFRDDGSALRVKT